jgi:hypothetical protein
LPWSVIHRRLSASAPRCRVTQVGGRWCLAKALGIPTSAPSNAAHTPTWRSTCLRVRTMRDSCRDAGQGHDLDHDSHLRR